MLRLNNSIGDHPADDTGPSKLDRCGPARGNASAERKRLTDKKPPVHVSAASGGSVAAKKRRIILTVIAVSVGVISVATAIFIGIEHHIRKPANDLNAQTPVLTDAATDMGPAGNETDAVYVNNSLSNVNDPFVLQVSANDLESFRDYIESNREKFDALCSGIQYQYETPLNVYRADTSDGVIRVNPVTVLTDPTDASAITDAWLQLAGDTGLIAKQYEVICGRLPEAFNEVVLVTDKSNKISRTVTYALGFKKQDASTSAAATAADSGGAPETGEVTRYSCDEIMNVRFKLLLNSDFFVRGEDGLWTNQKENAPYVKSLVETSGVELRIVGILRPCEDNVPGAAAGCIGYTYGLTEYALTQTRNSAAVQAQLADPTRDIITGKAFPNLDVNDFTLADVDLSIINFRYLDLSPFMRMLEDIDLSQIDRTNFKIEDFIDFSDMSPLQKRIVEGFLDDDQVLALKQAYVDTLAAECSLETTFSQLGYSGEDTPKSIYIYPKSYEDKEKINEMAEYFNNKMIEYGMESKIVTVTDKTALNENEHANNKS